MSIPSPSAPATRGWRVLRPIRLSTFLLLVLVIALMVSLALQRERERQLRDAIAVYRQPQTEAIFEAVARPMPLHYLDGARLDEVLKVWKRTTIGSPGLAPGIPIYVDPIGLQEAGQSLNSTLRRPPSADSLVSFRQPCKKHRADTGLECSEGTSARFAQIRARTGSLVGRRQMLRPVGLTRSVPLPVRLQRFDRLTRDEAHPVCLQHR